ncbi:Alpha/Beta hydrolase protein [Schizothecium vesticola]|uniref:Alpha/Beta hydrolase protein n=1 Tax=Schizothecium vesticola TaxID=314040 RepID=A0AA40F924_9PEZI|nr:Alpha/Beta hydrolase protein [Schizothecium vesticola]
MSLSLHTVGPSDGSPHTHTIIFLHGRDSEAKEFASEFFESEASGPDADRTLTALFPTTRWVFPQAKALRSERFDRDMSQWFDMWSLEDLQEGSELQVQGLRSSVGRVIKTINEEERLIPRDRIFLGGISQGFATALAVLFADGRGGFAGICGFCSWLPLADEVTTIIREHDPLERLTSLKRLYLGDTKSEQGPPALVHQLLSTPILLQHSRDDDTISVENGERMRHILGQIGFGREWYDYDDGGHWVNEPQGVDDLVRFLKTAMEKT